VRGSGDCKCAAFVGCISRSPGAEAILAYFEVYTYLGSDSPGAVALADKVAGRQPMKFAVWPGLNSRPRPSPEESVAAVKAGRFRPHCETKGGAIF
jgi:hypothetical protein